MIRKAWATRAAVGATLLCGAIAVVWALAWFAGSPPIFRLNFGRVAAGMPRSTVLDLLGPPDGKAMQYDEWSPAAIEANDWQPHASGMAYSYEWYRGFAVIYRVEFDEEWSVGSKNIEAWD